MKQILLSLFLAGALALTGCGASPASSALSQSAPAASAPAASAAPESEPAESAGQAEQAQPEPSASQAQPEGEEPDVDLTQMGANMVYAVVYQMTLDPAAHEGQTVKVAGEYYSAPGPQKTYSFLYVSDAAACCSQGLEFVLEGETGPEDYPEEGAQAVLTGTFETYTEEGDPTLYFRLRANPEDLSPP